MKRFKFFLSVLLLSVGMAYGQIDPRDAREHFERGNFPEAIKAYEKLLKAEPSNVEYNFNIGLSYLKLNRDKTQAIPHLERVLKEDKSKAEAHFFLGKAYQYNYQFDKAEKHYQEYLMATGSEMQHDAIRQIETCRNARDLVKKPLSVTFENLGSSINTPYPDYYPIVPPDESFMVFTSRRKGGFATMEFDGFYSSDIYMAPTENGKFVNAKMLGSGVNTSYDEQAVGLSADGDELFVYIDHLKEFGDIYLSKKNRTGFGRASILGPAVNSKEFETAGTISADGRTMFFASRREGGVGGTDLYMTRLLPNGEWAEPQNLGPTINTPLNEDFPYMLADGKSLFFSSQGHNSMGGYDIFTSQWDEIKNTWTEPANIGYPLNTPEDNMTIYFGEEGRTAYVSAFRKGGYGDLDIYRVHFEDKERRKTLVKGTIATVDANSASVDAMITVTDPETEEVVGTYLPNPVTRNYIMILPPGRYNLVVEASGFKPISDSLVLYDYAGFIPEMKKDFNLSP